MRSVFGALLQMVMLGFWLAVVILTGIYLAVAFLPPVLLQVAGFHFVLACVVGVRAWPGFVGWWGFEYLRTHYFAYALRGDPEGIASLTDGRPPSGAAPYLWAIYPHGFMPITGFFYWAMNGVFEGWTRGAIHTLFFYLPGMNLLAGWSNCIHADAVSMTRNLRAGTSLYMMPGGLSGALLTGNEIRKREGFLRLAKETGARLVPIWNADARSYYTLQKPLGDALVPYLGYPVVTMLTGHWWCWALPRLPARSRIYAGKPICFDDPSLSLEEGSRRFWVELAGLQRLADTEAPSVTAKIL